jgi:nickel-dependent lactate racemase
MRLKLPYGGKEIIVDIPDDNLCQVMSPKAHEPLANLDEALRRSISNPWGQPPPWEWIRPSDRVLILTDDNTRLTPTRRLLPPLLDVLRDCGVPREGISILMALGTHRPMTRKEMEAKVGEEVFKAHKVFNHEWRDPKQLVDMGLSEQGTPIMVNKAALEADVIIGIGAIVPHHISGFSGSSKIVQPGICGEVTTAETHLLSTRGEDTLLGSEDNPVRREMDEIARRVGMRTILNVVMTSGGEIAGVFFGETKAAFREGVKLAKEIYGIPLNETPDIVIANSFPCEIDFWQSHKSLYPAAKMVRRGGAIVILTPAPEGVSPVHGSILGFAGLPAEKIEEAYREGKIRSGVAAALAIAWAKVRQKATVIMVSEGIGRKEKELLGFLHARDVNEALRMAFKSQGKEARVSVLTHAPETLPLDQRFTEHGSTGTLSFPEPERH